MYTRGKHGAPSDPHETSSDHEPHLRDLSHENKAEAAYNAHGQAGHHDGRRPQLDGRKYGEATGEGHTSEEERGDPRTVLAGQACNCIKQLCDSHDCCMWCRRGSEIRC